MKLIVTPLAAGALLLAGCASGSSAAGAPFVATTSIWGDIATQIAACQGDARVATLTPIGADPHDYAASSADIAALISADLVISNGLGLEEGLASALQSAEADGANVFAVAPELDPQPFSQADDGHDDELADEDHADEDGESHSGDDPHVWLDASRAATGAQLIGEQMAAATGEDGYKTCGNQVADDIRMTNQEIITTLEPVTNRVLVTDHDAFGYFAAVYGFEVVGVVVPGGSTLGDPSSAEVAQLAATIEETGVPAIFANTANPQALLDALSAEAGGVEIVDLYVGSIGEPGGEAGTYQKMMLTNAQRISTALAG